MSEFYADTVHRHILQGHELALEKYRKRVLRELTWIGIEPDQLQNYTCLDVGTGYQAIVLAELGCRQVFHRDISHQQVQWLQDYCDMHGVKNIDSQQADLMSHWVLPEALDLSFIVGVYHHLADPPQFLRALWERSREGGQIFLRCYRSGTWSRWLCAHLRRISHHSTAEQIQAKYLQMHGDVKDGQFLGDMLDDLFVAEWKCFHPRQFHHDAEVLGMTVRMEPDEFDLDFDAQDENFRVLMVKRESQSVPAVSSEHFATAQSIDQLTLNLSIYSAWDELDQGFRVLERAAGTVDQEHVAQKLIELYQLVRVSRTQQESDRIVGNKSKTINEKRDGLLTALRCGYDKADQKTAGEGGCLS